MRSRTMAQIKMNNKISNNEFDVIIVGSGTCGATLADELSRQNKKVLLLEQGVTSPIKESVMGFAAMARVVSVGNKLQAPRGITTGGSTGIYFGVANDPPLDTFRTMGIDLTDELATVKKELPIATLPDALLGEQSIKLRQSAVALGHDWQKTEMLVDQTQCQDGYDNKARWRARTFVEQAVANGATLINRATVSKILIEDNQAIGVEYQHKQNALWSQTRRVYGTKIIIAAGGLATPKLLRDLGVEDVGSEGFYCDPGYGLFGLVPGMKGQSSFVGNGFCKFDDGIDLGDGNMSPMFHKLLMLSSLKFKHYFKFHETMGIGVKVHDTLGGTFDSKGRLHKTLNASDWAKLKKGEDEAIKILKNAGAKHIFNSGLVVAGHVGGLLKIGQHVDVNLETQFRNLHVCDGSLLSENIRVTPTVTLVCLAKYLSKHLAASL